MNFKGILVTLEHMKKFLIVLLVFLTACGDDSTQNEQPPEPNASAEIMVAPASGNIFGSPIEDAYKETNETLKSFITSDDVIEETMLRLEMSIGKNGITETNKKLTFNPSENQQLLEIFYYDPSPDKAVQFLDTLLWVVEEYYIETQHNQAENSMYFIQRQIDSVMVKLDTIQEQMKAYNAVNVPMTFEVSLIMSDYIEMSKFLEESKMNIHDLTQLKESLENDKKIPPSFDCSDSVLGDMLQEYQDRIVKKESKEKIDHLKHMVISYIDSTVEGLNQRILAAEEQLPFLKEKIEMLPKEVQELQEMQKQLKVQEQLYMYLLEKKAETEIAKYSITNPFMVLREPYQCR